MGRSRIIIRDRGWRDLKAELAKARGAGVKVGVMENVPPPEGSDLTMAEIAEVHEFGSTDGRIPERSFIRAGIDEGRERLGAVTRRATKQMVSGKITVRTALEIIGTAAKSLIQQKITRGPFVPNAPATIARKGSSRPLIDTGQLRRSIDYEVVMDGEQPGGAPPGGAGGGVGGSGGSGE